MKDQDKNLVPMLHSESTLICFTKQAAKALSHPSFILTVSFRLYCLLDQKTNLGVSSRSEPHSLARRKADEILCPPPATALHASEMRNKIGVLIHRRPF